MSDKCKIVCNYRRNKRPFTVKDAARVYCYAKQDTFEQVGFDAEFKRHVRERCGGATDEECDCARLTEIIRVASGALALAVVAMAAILTRSSAVVRHRRTIQRAIERGITIEGEVIRDITALGRATNRGNVSLETLQKAANELSLAEREILAREIRGIVIKGQ